jgi:hypothetical protein
MAEPTTVVADWRGGASECQANVLQEHARWCANGLALRVCAPDYPALMHRVVGKRR